MVALIMLLLITLISVSGMRAATIGERMAGNLRDQNLAFQAAEAGLRAGENYLAPLTERELPDNYPCPTGETCNIYANGALASPEDLDPDDDEPAEDAVDLAEMDHCWWTGGDGCRLNNTIAYVPAAMDDEEDAVVPWATDPRHVIEEHGSVRDSLRTGHDYYERRRDIFRITARGTGQTDDAEVRLQSTFAKRFN